MSESAHRVIKKISGQGRKRKVTSAKRSGEAKKSKKQSVKGTAKKKKTKRKNIKRDIFS
jgi:hypothetical protein